MERKHKMSKSQLAWEALSLTTAEGAGVVLVFVVKTYGVVLVAV